MRVADYIMKRLANEGLRHIFILPGGGAMHLNDALACESRITPIPCHHEQACGIAAEAYGRTSHDDNPGFGVALVTTGPGATNVITPVAGAWIDSIPMLVLSGQVKRVDRLDGRPLRQSGVQEVDIMGMVSGITKYAATVEDPHQVGQLLDSALAKMRTGRPGPVWIEVPLDVQGAEISENQVSYAVANTDNSKQLDEEQLLNVLVLLRTSKRPLILVGHGVRLSGAADSFRELIEAWQVPVVSTWNALDLINYSNPLYVGSPGVVALRAPNLAIQNCDLLISIGCRIDNVMTAYNPGNYAKLARKVVIDIDEAELDKFNFDIEEKICADAAAVIRFFLSIKDLPFDDRSAWLSRCCSWKSTYSVNDGKPFKSSETISHYQFVDVISDLIPNNTLISTGSSGLAIEAFYSTFRTKPGQRVFLTSGLGSMGYGLAASIGACLGNGCSKTIAIESDGSLMLNIQELATLKGLDLPITLFVMDNDGYASIRNTQRNYFNSRFIATGKTSGLHMPDIGSLAESFGLPCFRIDYQSQLRSTLTEVIEHKGPAICIVRLQSDETLWPKVAAIPQKDGSMLSMPLEDMTPLLDIESLEAEMIAPLSTVSYQARGLKDSST